MKTLAVTFIFAAVGISSLSRGQPTTASPETLPPSYISPEHLLTSIKDYTAKTAKLIGVTDNTLKKVNAILDSELPEGVFGQWINQTTAIIDKIRNKILHDVVIDKSTPQKDLDLLAIQVNKIVTAMENVFANKS